MRQEDTWNINLSNNHLIKIIEKQQTFNFFIERTEGIVKRERQRERQDFDRVNMVDPIPLRASAHEIWVKERKKKKEKRHERRNLARGGILSRAAYDQDYLRGNLRIQ